MKYKSHIINAVSRKAICITLILISGLAWFAGGALANTCHGGLGCLDCAETIHPQLPGMQMGMTAPHGCRQPLIPASACSFEVSPGTEKFQGIIQSERPEPIEIGGIFSAALDTDPIHTAGAFQPTNLYSGENRSAPIFLINQSLLC